MPRLAMNGNGWAGSIASGVRTGRMSDMNRSASASRSVAGQLRRIDDRDAGLAQLHAQRPPAVLLVLHQRADAHPDRVSCSAGVSPSSETS